MKISKIYWIGSAAILTLVLVLLIVIDHIVGQMQQNPLGPSASTVANTVYHQGKAENLSPDRMTPFAASPKPNNKTAVTIPKPVAECIPSKYISSCEIYQGGKILKSFRREDTITMTAPGSYSDLAGVTCFRGNNYRNSASYGTAEVVEKKLEKIWSTKTGFIDTWTGIGWNGQPAIVKWDEKTKQIMNLDPAKKQKPGLKEVIYAALDGKIYFLDLEDGISTRPFMDVGAPHKGSVTVDPRGLPLLYAGQGIDEVGGKKVDIGYRIFDLINQKQIFFINGLDTFAYRGWGAFDSNGIIDKKTDTLLLCGENGIFYTAKLNTRFEPDKRKISINPDMIKYRYEPSLKGSTGTENSVAVYSNYAYFVNNSGLLQCVNLDTLSPVWARNVTDDTDSTIAVEEEGDGNVWLYTACEVDRQGDGGYSYIRKIDALTGGLAWEKSIRCIYEENVNGGTLASPVIGKQDIGNLVIFNVARTEGSPRNNTGGKLIAYDKKTGSEVWTLNLDFYCWSSPVDVYTKGGTSYLILCDSGGNMKLIEGKTGKVLHQINLGANIEGSPAVYENMVVVGTRGQQIWGIKIK